MSPDGKERYRLEGYLSREEFQTFLEMGLARVAVMRKDWKDAQQRYDAVASTRPDSHFAAEAVYWRGVCRYKATNDHHVLGEVAEILSREQKDSVWTLKAVPWSH